MGNMHLRGYRVMPKGRRITVNKAYAKQTKRWKRAIEAREGHGGTAISRIILKGRKPSPARHIELTDAEKAELLAKYAQPISRLPYKGN
jgi:hypothetical protein